VHKTPGGGRHGAVFLAGLPHCVGQIRIAYNVTLGRKRDKALSKIDVARGERRADFALRDFAIERARQRTIGDLHRIVGCPDSIMRGDTAANENASGNGAKNAGNKRSRGAPRYAEKTFAEKKFAVCVLHCGPGSKLS